MARLKSGFEGDANRASYSRWVVTVFEKKLGSNVGRLASARIAPVLGLRATMAPPGLPLRAASAARCSGRSKVTTRSLPALDGRSPRTR